MSSGDNLPPRLPRENPDCVHDWERVDWCYFWRCRKCHYALSDFELVAPVEGDDEGLLFYRRVLLAREIVAEVKRTEPHPLCDCIASGNRDKPKQHGADSHAKNCAVYEGGWGKGRKV